MAAAAGAAPTAGNCAECGAENQGRAVTCSTCGELFVAAAPATAWDRRQQAPPAPSSPAAAPPTPAQTPQLPLPGPGPAAAMPRAPAPAPAPAALSPPATAAPRPEPAPLRPVGTEAEAAAAAAPAAAQVVQEVGCSACGNHYSMIQAGPPATHFCGACGHRPGAAAAASSPARGAPLVFGQLMAAPGGGQEGGPAPHFREFEEPTLSSISASFETESNVSAEPERSLLLRVSFLVLVCTGSVGIYFGYNIVGATAPYLQAAPYGMSAEAVGSLAAMYSIPNTVRAAELPLLARVSLTAPTQQPWIAALRSPLRWWS